MTHGKQMDPNGVLRRKPQNLFVWEAARSQRIKAFSPDSGSCGERSERSAAVPGSAFVIALGSTHALKCACRLKISIYGNKNQVFNISGEKI